MLLRSLSTPILNSWTPNSKESSPEPEIVPQIRRNRCIPLTGSISSLSSVEGSSKKISRALSESDLWGLSLPKRKPVTKTVNRFPSSPVEEREEQDWYPGTASSGGLSWGGGWDEGGEGVCVEADSEDGGGGSGGGCVHVKSGYGDSNNGNGGMDSYYQMMIKANPGNALLLGNYARFLKEIRGRLYQSRRVPWDSNSDRPSDENYLSLYADLKWEIHRDSDRAERYYDQAVKASPDDCYALASYARFLWDADGEEEEEKGEYLKETSSCCFLEGSSPPRPPLAAAS